MNVDKNRVVTIDYELTDASGQLIETSKGQGPLSYLHGAGTILPALEDELAGKQPGESVQATLPPDRAYGEREEELRQAVPRDRFQGQGDVEIQVGMQFRGQLGQTGEERVFTVVDVSDQAVTIDGNHPLAGVTLNFAVEVVEVRDATPEEIEHGHPHGPGGHEH